jgi:hypothetical protein
MFIAEGPGHLALRRSAMCSLSTADFCSGGHMRNNSYLLPHGDGTPPERDLGRTLGYKHCTPPE